MIRRSVLPALAALAATALALPAAESIEPGKPASPPHWAYQPLTHPAPPAAKNSAWPLTDIDRFVLAKLDRHGLAPAPPAESATLCRRLYFDLIGLPPTPAELDEFQKAAAADRPSAITRLADRLLASPQFGEHFGRHWLDVARFGESLSLRGFILKEAWRYRDYVIDSFNHDVPFDRFIREQLAGNLLPATNPAARRRQLVAATFLALGNTNLEEQDKKQLDMDVVDEQLDTLGKAFLAQTIGCARCHDHKFDPLPTRDYYAMAGILRNTRLLKHANVSEWLEVPLPVDPAQEETLKQHEKAVAALEDEIKSARQIAKAASSGTPGASNNLAGIIAARDLPGIVVDSAQARQVGEWKHSTFSGHFIGDGYFHDDNKEKGARTMTFQPELPRPGRYEVRLAYVPAQNRATNVPVTVFHADGETLLRVNQQDPPLIDGRFVSLGTFRFETNGFAHALVANDATRGYVTADAVQFLPEDSPTPARPAGKLKARNPKPEARSPKYAPQFPAYQSATNLPDIKALEEKLKKLKASGPRRPMTMGVKEAEHIEDSPIYIRGSVHNPGPVVPRGFPTFGRREDRRPTASIGRALPANESGRRQLADWIADPSHPLTARVYVNRVWLWLMGEGLVRTPDNFGTTGEAPSHPELLDDLASNFIQHGWSTKWLVREIITSQVYQERIQSTDEAVKAAPSSAPPPADPENRWLAHAHRRRLAAEQLRDAILAVSGQLKFSKGGPGFPAGLTADFGYKFNEPVRSVYAPVFRNAVPEMLDVFDFPSPCIVTGRRESSIVPMQALFLLNHAWVREQAVAAARRVLDEPNDAARLERAYRAALGRMPDAAERTLALRRLKGASKAARVEAWADLFQALFASAEFRYLE